MKPANEVRVLVVEDDPFFTRILQKRLSAEGYQVFTAADGRAGMKAIVQHEPDLVISDWMMPEVDGLELCQSVKTGLRDAAPYFILLTAKGEVSDKLLALDTGADDYMVKPCDQFELLARVRAGLRIVGLQQTLRSTVANLRTAQSGRDEPRAAGLPASDASAPAACPELTVCGCGARVREGDGPWIDAEAWVRERAGGGRADATCDQCREAQGGEQRAIA